MKNILAGVHAERRGGITTREFFGCLGHHKKNIRRIAADYAGRYFSAPAGRAFGYVRIGIETRIFLKNENSERGRRNDDKNWIWGPGIINPAMRAVI